MNVTQKQINADLDVLDDNDFTFCQTAGTDSLGRKIDSVSALNTKYVGIFYCEWMGYSTKKIFDIAKLTSQYPDMETSPLWAVSGEYYNPNLSPNVDFHFWSEPLYGYYNSNDPWVIRKHMEILAAIGVDYIMIDNTNAITYNDTTKVILETVKEMLSDGLKAPKVSFLLPNDEDKSVATLKTLHGLWYSDAKYDECWFRADENLNPSGKPLIVGRFLNAVNTGLISQKIADSLWLKEMQWPTTNEMQKNADSMPWIDWCYPQTNHNGIMSVSVAQHIDGTWSSEASRYLAETTYSARGWTTDSPFDPNDTHGENDDNVLSGTNFQNQWDTAISQDVDMVLVTGFNEWIAQKLSNEYGVGSPSYRADKDIAVFVDLFDMAYSRDVEMMKGGYGDNYLMQLAMNIRNFKGVKNGSELNVYESLKTTIDVNNILSWETVNKKYVDFGMNLTARNFISVDPMLTYTDNTNRNDFDYVKFANDGTNLYVYVKTKNDITAYNGTDKNWMNIYISDGTTSSYQYVINRTPLNGSTTIEKIKSDKTTEVVGSASYFVSGSEMAFAIPLNAIAGTKSKNLQIKCADNIQDFGNHDDFYISGDCAPIGRLNYVYKIV